MHLGARHQLAAQRRRQLAVGDILGEQLKSELDSKPWLKKEEKIKILNLASDIMNHWRQYRDVDSVESVKNKFLEASFIDTKS